MGKLTFIAGLAAGYVLGARAGQAALRADPRAPRARCGTPGRCRSRCATAKEVARTKAAPVVADMVADAARATGEKLRSSRTVEAEAIETGAAQRAPPDTTTGRPAPSPTGSGADPWAAATSRTDGAA